MAGRRLRRFAASGVVALALAILVPVAGAATLTAEIAPNATLISRGEAILVSVTVACASGSDVLEAFIYVVQDGNTSQFAGIPVRCTDKPHRYVVMVRAFPDSPFRSGTAQVSGYVLVASGDSTESISPTREVEIR